MIKTFISGTLEKLSNRLLNLDPQTIERLKPFAGKIILIEITDWQLKIYLLITMHGLQFLNHYEGSADTILKGSALSLLRAGKSKETQLQDVIIDGDIELGKKFREIFRSIDIDWEEQLAKVTGDVIAHQVGAATRAFISWTTQSARSLQQDFTEYLQEESRILPTRYEVEEFIDGVTEVRNAVERLEKRINLIEPREH